MQKTFVITLSDRFESFFKAVSCIVELGLRVLRISYQKSVDVYTVFIEVGGKNEMLTLLEEQFKRLGYLDDSEENTEFVLLEFALKDFQKNLLLILELAEQHRFDISFFNAWDKASKPPMLRIGFIPPSRNAVTAFLCRAEQICPVTVVEYHPGEVVLDHTHFYRSFADAVAKRMRLSTEEQKQLMICSNLMMQCLQEQKIPPYHTFASIYQIAVSHNRGQSRRVLPRVSCIDTPAGHAVWLYEPPCGSNTVILQTPSRLLFVDAGLPCGFEAMQESLRQIIPDFDARKKELLLTHADVDHLGNMDAFDAVYMIQKNITHFCQEAKGEAGVRENGARSSAYVKLYKILSKYRPPKRENFVCIGGNNLPMRDLLTPVGTWTVDLYTFEVYEGKGGHVLGETVYIERKCRWVFCGDIYVNIRGFTKEQKNYIRLASCLLSSVDTDPKLADEERSAIIGLLTPGKWLLFGGHGTVLSLETPKR